MTPRVSIVTPSYNQADFLSRTIDSVLSQEYPDLEYGIMDGGSTDGSLEIIKNYADRLSWWVSEPDEGQGHAIQKGFARCTGKYLAWLNSDDEYLPGFIDEAVKVLEANPDCPFVYTDMLSIDKDGGVIKTFRYEDLGFDDLLQFRIIGQPGVIMRREAYEKAGGIDPAYRLLLDHDLWIRLAKNNQPVHIPKVLIAARHHAQAKNSKDAAGFGQEALRIATKYIDGDTIEGTEGTVGTRKEGILAGAYWLGARYLSVARNYSEALRWYRKAWQNNPSRVVEDWKRVLVTLVGLTGIHLSGSKNG